MTTIRRKRRAAQDIQEEDTIEKTNDYGIWVCFDIDKADYVYRAYQLDFFRELEYEKASSYVGKSVKIRLKKKEYDAEVIKVHLEPDVLDKELDELLSEINDKEVFQPLTEENKTKAGRKPKPSIKVVESTECKDKKKLLAAKRLKNDHSKEKREALKLKVHENEEKSSAIAEKLNQKFSHLVEDESSEEYFDANIKLSVSADAYSSMKKTRDEALERFQKLEQKYERLTAESKKIAEENVSLQLKISSLEDEKLSFLKDLEGKKALEAALLTLQQLISDLKDFKSSKKNEEYCEDLIRSTIEGKHRIKTPELALSPEAEIEEDDSLVFSSPNGQSTFINGDDDFDVDVGIHEEMTSHDTEEEASKKDDNNDNLDGLDKNSTPEPRIQKGKLKKAIPVAKIHNFSDVYKRLHNNLERQLKYPIGHEIYNSKEEMKMLSSLVGVIRSDYRRLLRQCHTPGALIGGTMRLAVTTEALTYCSVMGQSKGRSGKPPKPGLHTVITDSLLDSVKDARLRHLKYAEKVKAQGFMDKDMANNPIKPKNMDTDWTTKKCEDRAALKRALNKLLGKFSSDEDEGASTSSQQQQQQNPTESNKESNKSLVIVPPN